MNKKILPQLLDSIKLTPLSLNESIELVIQLVVWSKISETETIPKELRLSPSLNTPDLLLEALAKLGLENGLVGQAFPDTRSISRIDPTTIRSIVDLLLTLNNAGVLKTIQVNDIIEFFRLSIASEFSIPEKISMLLVGVACVHATDTIYTPWDFSGQLSEIASKNVKEVYSESPMHSAIPALISLLADKQFHINYTDPVRSPSVIENGKLRKFDVAIALPPMGLRYGSEIVNRDWFGRFPEHGTSGTVLSVRHMMAQARRRVVVAVQNSLLFSPGVEREFRENLLQSGMLKAVVAMPAGLLYNTNVPFSILVIDLNGNIGQVRFINADTPFFKEATSKAKCQLIHIDELISQINDQGDSAYAIDVPTVEVLKNDAQLQVGRYVLADSSKQLQARLASSPTVILGDLVSTVRPMPTVTAEGEGIEAYEIGALDLPSQGYILQPGRGVTIDSQISVKQEEQFLQPMDIVLIVKGSVGKIGIVPLNVPPAGAGGWVAGQSAIVLRCLSKNDIEPRALAVQLRSEFGQELLNSIVSGASIKIIQLRELLRLSVLSPSADENKRAADILDRESDIQEEIERLRHEQIQIGKDMWALF